MGSYQVSLDRLSDDALLEVCSYVRNLKEQVHGSRIWQTSGWGESRYLSALQSWSLTNRRLRDLTWPMLFSKINIRGSLSRSSRALKVFDDCPRILDTAKKFTFEISTIDDTGPRAPENVADMLATALIRMPKLKLLIIRLPKDYADVFAASFINNNVSLDTVQIVAAGSFCGFVIVHCPNAGTFSAFWGHHPCILGNEASESAEDRKMHASLLIRAAGRATNVTHFEMLQQWSADLVKQVYNHLPHLHTLAMLGCHYEDAPDSYLHIIGRFTSLRTLILAHAAFLRVGFDPPGQEAYLSPDSEKKLDEEYLKTQRLVAQMVFESSKTLETVWVGDDSEANVRRDADRQVTDIKWTHHSRQKPLECLDSC